MIPGSRGNGPAHSMLGKPREVSSHRWGGVSELTLPGVNKTIEDLTPLRIGSMQCLCLGLHVTHFWWVSRQPPSGVSSSESVIQREGGGLSP